MNQITTRLTATYLLYKAAPATSTPSDARTRPPALRFGEGPAFEQTNPPGDCSFQARYCKRHDCNRRDFERRVFWQCTSLPSRPLTRLLWLLNRNWFRVDLALIADAGAATHFTECRDIVRSHRHRKPANPLLRKLGIGVCPIRLLELAHATFCTLVSEESPLKHHGDAH